MSEEQARALVLKIQPILCTLEDGSTEAATTLIAAALREATAKGLEELARRVDAMHNVSFGLGYNDALTDVYELCRTQAQQARKETP